MTIGDEEVKRKTNNSAKGPQAEGGESFKEGLVRSLGIFHSYKYAMRIT